MGKKKKGGKRAAELLEYERITTELVLSKKYCITTTTTVLARVGVQNDYDLAVD